ncbi:MAG: hypothetical protein AAGF15_12325 [Pseudomonadota bacterium]
MRKALTFSFFVGVWIGICAGAAFAAPKDALFQSTDPLTIELSSPELSDLIRSAAKEPKQIPATLTYENITGSRVALPVEVAPRGRSRRRLGICRFPPLRVHFGDDTKNDALFGQQSAIKLVTHCSESYEAEQRVMKEYLAYRVYMLLTDASFQVRLAKIRYLNGDRQIAHRYGFFIEDVDHVAARLGLKELEARKLKNAEVKSWHNADNIALIALFQYMISNLDWSVTSNLGSLPCCHNVKLVAAKAERKSFRKTGEPEAVSEVMALPYDFDYSGLVDAPYAVVNGSLSRYPVTTRIYWGFCDHNQNSMAARAEVIAQRAAILAELNALTELSPRNKRKARSFLERSLDIMSDDKRFERILDRRCR